MKYHPIVTLCGLFPTLLSAQVVFSDNFNISNGPDGAWTSLNGQVWAVTNQTYYTTSSLTNAFNKANGVTFVDGVVSAQVMVDSGPHVDGGLFVRGNGVTGNIENGVIFVAMDGDIYFHVVVGGAWGGPLGSVLLTSLLPGDLRNLSGSGFTMTVNVSGNSYTGTISDLAGTTIYGSTSYTDTAFTYTSGDVGLYSNSSNIRFDNYSVTAVPEPSTYAALFGLAALGFAGYRRRQRKC